MTFVMPAWAVAENLIFHWQHPWRCEACPWREFRTKRGVEIHARAQRRHPPLDVTIGDGPIRRITAADHKPFKP